MTEPVRRGKVPVPAGKWENALLKGRRMGLPATKTMNRIFSMETGPGKAGISPEEVPAVVRERVWEEVRAEAGAWAGAWAGAGVEMQDNFQVVFKTNN